MTISLTADEIVQALKKHLQDRGITTNVHRENIQFMRNEGHGHIVPVPVDGVEVHITR